MAFDDYIRGLLKELFPGVWQQETLCLPARSDTYVPHIHGRVPDLVELGDIPIPSTDKQQQMGEECESYSWWFNPSSMFDGLTAMEVEDLPADECRPLGAPLVQIIKVSSSHIVVRNWHELPHDGVRIVSMTRGSRPDFEQEPLRQLGVRCDFYGTPYTGPAAGVDVQFTDLTTYACGDFQPSSWHWDFGDGGSSSDQNPSHHYAGNPGDTFDVTVEITFAGGRTCTVIKEDYIVLT